MARKPIKVDLQVYIFVTLLTVLVGFLLYKGTEFVLEYPHDYNLHRQGVK